MDCHIHCQRFMMTVIQLDQIILHIAPLKAVSLQTVDSHNRKIQSEIMNRRKQIKKRSQMKRQPRQSHGGHTYESLVLMNVFRRGEQPSSDDCDVFQRI